MLDGIGAPEASHPAIRLESFEETAMRRLSFDVATSQVEAALQRGDTEFFRRGLAFLRLNDLARTPERDSARAIARMRYEKQINPAVVKAWEAGFAQRNHSDALMLQQIAQIFAPIPGSKF